MRHVLLATAILFAPLAAAPVSAASPAQAIAAAVNDPARPAADRARDRYRHPAETLSFFGVAPGQTVVELYPGGGWFTRIILPLVGPQGRYIAATAPGEKATAGAQKIIAGIAGAHPNASVAAFDPKAPMLAPPGSVDRVLTFRNVHNFLMGEDGAGAAEAFFTAAFAALKPGGVLGIEEHHLPESADSAREQTSGYVKRSTIIRLATAAGFKLAGESAINANPKDTHDWPKGVWTLPPTLTLGDTDRAKYLAIGESDRMTLKFVKPAR